MPQPTKGPRLGGSPAHERLMLANLATSLFRHGKIQTTEAKARRLRPFAERLVTFAKRGDLSSRRRVLTVIRDKDVVHALFADIGPKFATRPGGYTRIVKIGPRKGDAAPMAVIELVEELVLVEPKRRAKRAAARKSAKADAVAALAGEDDEDDAPAKPAKKATKASKATKATKAAAGEPADDEEAEDADEADADDADEAEEKDNDKKS